MQLQKAFLLAMLVLVIGPITQLGESFRVVIEKHAIANDDVARPTLTSSQQAGVIASVANVLDARVLRILEGPGWDDVRYAFGNKSNPIQYSWEKEGTRPQKIVQLFRPKRIAESDWLARTPQERATYAMNLPASTRWQDWVRLTDAPEWIRRELVIESSPGVWEIITDSFNETVADTVSQMAVARSVAGTSGGHFHVTFLPNPRFAKELAAFLEHLDAYYSWQLIRDWPDVLGHDQLGPHTAVTIDHVEQALATSGHFPIKGHSVDARSRMYTPRERIGFEIRAAGGSAIEDGTELKLVGAFLEDPLGAALNLYNPGDAYRIEDLLGADRLTYSTISRLGDDAALDPIRAIAQRANARLGTDAHMTRWAYPLVRWEQRPHAAHLVREIDAARAAYVGDVLQTVDAWQNAGSATQHSAHWAQQIDAAVQRFAVESRLPDSF